MKSINENAPVISRSTIMIEAKPEKIWNVLTDIDNWPRWHTEIEYAKLHGPLEASVGFTWKSGGMKINSILHTVAPFYSLGWTGKTLGINAIHNWILKAVEGGTEVAVSESMEGLIVKIFKRKIQQTLDTSMTQWLERLKEESEKDKLSEAVS
jgi:hypothetical protein